MISGFSRKDYTRRVAIFDAMQLFGKSHATIYSWRNKYKWESEYDDEGRAFLHIPEEFITKRSVQAQDKGFNGQDSPLYTGGQPDTLDSPVLLQLLETQNVILESLVKDRKEVGRLNREIENRGHALIRYREQEKRVQSLIETVEILQRDIESIKSRSPWWKFWR